MANHHDDAVQQDRRVAQRRVIDTADYKGPERRMSERRDTSGPLDQK